MYDGDALWSALDLGWIYARWPAAIDSVVYFTVFLGVAQVTLGRRFDGRGGQALVIGVGVALAVAATTAAQTVGFTLAQLGPYAWGVLLLVLGVTAYDFLRRLSMPRLPAAGVAVLLLSLIGAGSPVRSLARVFGVGLGLTGLAGIALLLLLGWGVYTLTHG